MKSHFKLLALLLVGLMVFSTTVWAWEYFRYYRGTRFGYHYSPPLVGPAGAAAGGPPTVSQPAEKPDLRVQV